MLWEWKIGVSSGFAIPIIQRCPSEPGRALDSARPPPPTTRDAIQMLQLDVIKSTWTCAREITRRPMIDDVI